MSTQLDLEKLVEEGHKIYVRNLTRPRGNIFLTLFDAAHKPVNLTIPAVPFPFCVSDLVPRYAINEGGSMLKSALYKQAIELVDPVTAEKELTPEVKEIVRQAVLSNESVNDEIRKYRAKRESDEKRKDISKLPIAPGLDPKAVITDPNKPIMQLGIQEDDSQDREGDGNDPEVQGVSTPVRVLVAQIESKELGAKEARNQLMIISDTLTQQDFVYLNANTTGQVREYVQKAMAERGSTLNADNENTSSSKNLKGAVMAGEDNDEDAAGNITKAATRPR